MVSVDRLRETLRHAGRATRLIVLGCDGKDFALNEVAIREINPNFCFLETEQFIRSGTAVRLDYDDMMLLGEVIESKRVGSQFQTAVRFEQVLNSLGDLARLVEGIMGRVPTPDRVQVPR
ncbi:MAG TPA: hypothetical protein VE621_23610 [Bryobacteraceae bacterium]|jgi:hypothetical protein|nr:hypothetical protein [Bryobacteraceae bacterium]